jgi:DNA repair exonuclease SbcCD ATPase subunit
MEEMLKQILAGQQEILATLQQHSEILNQHSEILNQHSEILNQHSEILRQHSQQLEDLQKRQLKIENRLDNEIVPKINALFDAFELRGDQIEKLQKHFDERLDVITMDVNFLMGKTARMDTALVEMRRAK